MTTTFTGEVRIPGSIENGLPSTITLDAQTLVLTAGGTELGRWNRDDLKLRREPDGSFHLTLGREVVLFNPDSPLEFAILSGMPGAGTAPAPAAAEPVVPTQPAPTPPPLASAEPAVPQPTPPAPVLPNAAVPPPAPAPPVAPTPAAPQPLPSTPPPEQASPLPTTPPPAAPEPAAAPPVPIVTPAAPAAPPAAIPETPVVPPPRVQPAATAPPQTAPQPSAPTPAAAAPLVSAPAPVEIHLEENTQAAPSAEHAASPMSSSPPTDPGPGAPPGEAPRRGASTDFWDGFYAEEEQEASMPGVPETGSVAEAATAPSSGFQLEEDLENAADDGDSRVGGYGSGLFSEDDDKPVHPTAFAAGGDEIGEGRAWSYYDEQEDGDRSWSYGDDQAEDDGTEEPPAFRSPAADRDDLVQAAKSSRLRGIAGWRPSLPSFSFGSSALGMRARDALGVLDAILEENGTEDIPKAFIFGLGGFAALLGVVAILVVLFG